MKRFALFAAILCLLCGLCACSEPAESSAPESSEPVITTTTTQPADDKVTYTVTVKDEAGNPIADANVQICSDMCVPAKTDANGVATWKQEEDEYKVSFLTLPAGYTYVDEGITNFYFKDDETEMTITLKKAAE
ncbi:MAG: Ig-like domain-containing protein [Clostridia bacterium]|nr:Ig-like domain-containing protein [Clostridia bacterium]